MTKKVKLSDVARDLQISTQELIGFYQERDASGNTKKGVTGLTPEEINLALEYYSQKTQVDSLDAYFASKDTPRKQEKKPAEKKSAEKKPAEKKSADKKPAEKKQPENKKQQKPQSGEKKPQAQKTEKPAEKKPAAAEAPAQNSVPKHEKPKKQQAKAQKHGERLHVEVEMASADSINTEKRRTVDTRGSYVDLDKYNQR